MSAVAEAGRAESKPQTENKEPQQSGAPPTLPNEPLLHFAGRCVVAAVKALEGVAEVGIRGRIAGSLCRLLRHLLNKGRVQKPHLAQR